MTDPFANIRFFPLKASTAGPVVEIRVAHATDTAPRRLPNAVDPAATPDCMAGAPAIGGTAGFDEAADTCCYHYRSHRHGTRPAIASGRGPRVRVSARKGLLP